MSLLNSFALATLNSLSAHIALVDSHGVIMAVNDSWRLFAEANGARTNVMEDANYLSICRNTQGKDAGFAQSFCVGFDDVLSGKAKTFEMEYPCHSPRERRWFVARITRFHVDNRIYAVVAHETITERKLAEKERYLQTKATTLREERRRISRELHDGVNQALFASLSISRALPRIYEKEPTRIFPMLGEIVDLNQAALSEMRVLLNELRPDSIVNTPLSTLIQQLVDTATHRIDGTATLQVNGSEFPLSDDVHLGLYRIAQESIHNILKHSQASNIVVSLTYTSEQIRLTIEDDGCGFDMHQVARRIGLNSMVERAAEIKADLKLDSVPQQGTTVDLNYAIADT